ncbi:MAG: DUF3883 domain-containing protein [SAR324 cluster bacterium]|nr:DUF3883 domain-containing protein [SAR324 cluster bacterium]
MYQTWTLTEVEIIVEDYFSMLRSEMLGKFYNKVDHCKKLFSRLDLRIEHEIELMYQNISAALIELGLPSISGYKPLYNYQKELVPAVIREFLQQNHEFSELFLQDTLTVPKPRMMQQLLEIMESAPKSSSLPLLSPNDAEEWVGINYLELEARNQQLGDVGEKLVIAYEKARLRTIGRIDLLNSVEQVSKTLGPNAGYDIRSFEQDGKERFIEVKTTKYGKMTPFFVTANELLFSERNREQYNLYRVFNYRVSPSLFQLSGQLNNFCRLRPSIYRAYLA